MTCDSANAITDAGFVMFKATDGSGNNFYVTGIVDNNEGVFNTLTVVGEEANTSHNNGAYNKTNVQEIGLSDDDFKSTATITTGDYMDMVMVGGPNATPVMAMQKIALDQTVYDNIDSNAFLTGFSFRHGMLMTAGDPKMYKTFDINLNVNSGSAATGDLLNNTFQLLETALEGTGANAGDTIVGKTLMIDQTLDDQADSADTFTQQFIQNEAAGSAVAGSGTVVAGAGGAAGSASFTFAQGDTLAVKTLEQNLNGAAADFGLSDAADESGTTNQEAGVDNQLGIAAMSATMDNTNLNDPFVSF
jgi:hypothetical protein